MRNFKRLLVKMLTFPLTVILLGSSIAWVAFNTTNTINQTGEESGELSEVVATSSDQTTAFDENPSLEIHDGEAEQNVGDGTTVSIYGDHNIIYIYGSSPAAPKTPETSTASVPGHIITNDRAYDELADDNRSAEDMDIENTAITADNLEDITSKGQASAEPKRGICWSVIYSVTFGIVHVTAYSVILGVALAAFYVLFRFVRFIRSHLHISRFTIYMLSFRG